MPDIRKYGFIDALRGYAILLVVLTHSAQFFPPDGPRLQALISMGAHGVQLFYVASALTLCLSWLHRTGSERSPVRNFFIRRFFRIAPLFYVAMVGYLCLYGFAPRYWAPNGIHGWFIALTALFLHGFNPQTIDSVVPGGWSVAVEMNFYLILPFLLPWLTTLRRAACCLCLSLGLNVVSRWGFHHLYSAIYPDNQQYLVASFLGLNVFSQLPVFALGIIVFRLLLEPATLDPAVRTGNALCLAAGVAALSYPTTALHWLSNPLIAGLACAHLSLNFARYRMQALNNAAVRWMGKVSFSLYLIHYAIADLLFRWRLDDLDGYSGAWLLHFLVILGIATPLSYVCYLAIERPGIALGARLIGHLERRDSLEIDWRPDDGDRLAPSVATDAGYLKQ